MPTKQILLSLLAILFLSLIIFFWRDLVYLLTPSQTFKHEDGVNRTYSLRLPNNYSEEKTYPLVIMLHGYKGHAKLMELYTGMTHLARQKDFIVVYPYGIERSWNGGFCCGTAWEEDIADASFIENLIAELKTSQPIDPKKIYLIGFSNGGVLAQQLISRSPNNYAGAAIVMSGAGDDTDAMIDIPSSPPPMIFYFGDEDKYIGQHEIKKDTDLYQFFPVKKTKELWLSSRPNISKTSSEEIDLYSEELYGNSSTTQFIFRTYVNQPHHFPEWRATHPFTKIPQSVKDIWGFFTESSQ